MCNESWKYSFKELQIRIIFCETLGIRLGDDLHPDVEAGVGRAVRLVEGDPEVVHAVTHELLDHLGQGGDGDRTLDISR